MTGGRGKAFKGIVNLFAIKYRIKNISAFQAGNMFRIDSMGVAHSFDISAFQAEDIDKTSLPIIKIINNKTVG